MDGADCRRRRVPAVHLDFSARRLGLEAILVTYAGNLLMSRVDARGTAAGTTKE
jgi:hypothetical protein